MSLLGVKGQQHVLLIEKAQTHVLSWYCVQTHVPALKRDQTHVPQLALRPNACPTACAVTKRMCVLPKRKKQKARPKGVNLKVRWRAKVAMR